MADIKQLFKCSRCGYVLKEAGKCPRCGANVQCSMGCAGNCLKCIRSTVNKKNDIDKNM